MLGDTISEHAEYPPTPTITDYYQQKFEAGTLSAEEDFRSPCRPCERMAFQTGCIDTGPSADAYCWYNCIIIRRTTSVPRSRPVTASSVYGVGTSGIVAFTGVVGYYLLYRASIWLTLQKHCPIRTDNSPGHSGTTRMCKRR